MSDVQNRRILLAARPQGRPKPGDFTIEDAPVPEPGENQVLLETLYLSLDPYMRGRMSDAKSYAEPVAIGDVMVGGTVSRVRKSRHPKWSEGDLVLSYSGWQRYALSDGHLRRLDPAAAPLSAHLGVLGMPGFTAYAGMRNIGRPKAGETVAVAAASGAVGSVVGQIARIHGARAVGITTGAEKLAFVRDELGFDAAADHRDPDLRQRLKEACPDGIDVYFENVGGHVWDAVFPLLNPFARIPVCGLIAHYNDTGAAEGRDRLAGLMRQILTKSLTFRGFIQNEFVAEQERDFLREASGWIADGKLRWREDMVRGLDAAPEAFIGLLEGRNFGKLVVEVSKP